MILIQLSCFVEVKVGESKSQVNDTADKQRSGDSPVQVDNNHLEDRNSYKRSQSKLSPQ